jgi:hypothetical protein
MSTISKSYTFTNGSTILAEEHNTNFDTLYNWANGNITNANIKSGAAISLSKLSLSDSATFSGAITFSGEVTFSGTVTGILPTIEEGDADKVLTVNAGEDGVEWAAVPDGVPSGVIVMWSGTVATIPTGWFLCDGENDTPDLRDRFIVGAKEDDGGVAKTNVTGSLTQSGDGTIPSHTHTGPDHTHTYSIGSNTGTGMAIGGSAQTGTLSTSSSGTGDTGTAGTGTKNIAVYYALALIMKG